MITFAEKKYHSDLLRWLIVPSLILTLLGGVVGQQIQPDFSVSSAYSMDAYQVGGKFLHDADLSSLHNVLSDFEVEEGDDEEVRSSNLFYASAVSLPLVRKERIGIPLFPPKKLVKLFILFHSWKSFLLS
ncbi:MAG: hypothetical protein GYB31_20065 [Bacteroidetes bacterium]|nr:hypothetical protein [Bacteroidota bacterium]